MLDEHPDFESLDLPIYCLPLIQAADELVLRAGRHMRKRRIKPSAKEVIRERLAFNRTRQIRGANVRENI